MCSAIFHRPTALLTRVLGYGFIRLSVRFDFHLSLWAYNEIHVTTGSSLSVVGCVIYYMEYLYDYHSGVNRRSIEKMY